jgi:hypothetical protein
MSAGPNQTIGTAQPPPRIFPLALDMGLHASIRSNGTLFYQHRSWIVNLD